MHNELKIFSLCIVSIYYQIKVLIIMACNCGRSKVVVSQPKRSVKTNGKKPIQTPNKRIIKRISR